MIANVLAPKIVCGTNNAGALRDALRASPDGAEVVLDLRALEELDYPALGALVGGVRDVWARGGRVEVSAISPCARRLLNATGLARVLLHSSALIVDPVRRDDPVAADYWPSPRVS